MSNLEHFQGHQQALLKNNICFAVLSFPYHDIEAFNNTFAQFDHDLVVDLCETKQDAYVGAAWNGSSFIMQPYPSWTLGEDLEWHAPLESPGEEYYWDEKSLLWRELFIIEPITVQSE
jgi:hypothetical protein